MDLKDVYKDAAANGSTVVVYPDGGFKVVPLVKKEEKQNDAKSEKKEEKGDNQH